MDKQFNAAISFLGYRVMKLELDTNSKFDESKNIDVDFDINAYFNINEDKQLFSIELDCQIFKDPTLNNKPFYMNVILNGLFKYDANLKDEQIRNLVRTNAVAILFPYLRSIITNITTTCGFPPLLLPTLNISEYLKKKNQ